MVPLALSTGTRYCFWYDTCGYSTQEYKEIVGIKSVLHQTNSNLSSSQKEVLLWHQQLSHASTNWIQTLMQDRKWLPNTGYLDTALHLGPFIVTTSRAPTCNVSNMKYVACLFAKASTRSPANMAPHPSPKNLTLKGNHLAPGDCVSLTNIFLSCSRPSPAYICKRTCGISLRQLVWGPCKWQDLQFSSIFQQF